MPRALVIALRPSFADAIYRKTKAFEFRRVRMTAQPEDIVFIYETAPVQLVTGQFRIASISTASPSNLTKLEPTKRSRRIAGSYLKGCKLATAMEVGDPRRWKIPIPFSSFMPGHRPPQSYMFVRGLDGILRGRSK